MWRKSYSVITTAVTKEQLWKLFADVNTWHHWDDEIEFARLEGPFEKGNHFFLKPKGGPKVKITLLETVPNHNFLDVTPFPLAKMYDNHIFEETPEGLKITNVIWVKGILSFLWIKLVAQKIVDTLPAQIKRQIEAASKL